MRALEWNKIVVRRFFEELDAQRLDCIAEHLFAPCYELHFDSLPPMNAVGFKCLFAPFYEAFPDLHHTLEDQAAEGCAVISRVVARGTHLAPFQGVPPSGRRIELRGVHIHHLADARITQHWILTDSMDLMRQLGVLPAAFPNSSISLAARLS